MSVVKSSSVAEIHIISRLASLPLVNSAWAVAAEGYGKIKSYSGLVNATLSKAETTIWFVAETSKPVINKLEKPIHIADNLACRGLDKLEEKMPVIKKSPEELKDEAQKLFDGWNRIVVAVNNFKAAVLVWVVPGQKKKEADN